MGASIRAFRSGRPPPDPEPDKQAYGYFVLPESLPPSVACDQLGACQSRRRVRVTAWASRALGLAGVGSCQLSHASSPRGRALHTSYRVRLGRADRRLTLAAVVVASGVVQAGLIRPIINRLASGPP